MITINRAIDGIGLNGLECLLDDDNNPILFESEIKAMGFLKKNGYELLSEEDIRDIFIFNEE